MAYVSVGDAAAVVVERARPQPCSIRQMIDDRDGSLALLEMGPDGDVEVRGPETTHAEVQQIARIVLELGGRGVPTTLHKLALAYLHLTRGVA